MIFEDNIVYRENGQNIGKIVEEQVSETYYTYGFISEEGIILIKDDLEEIYKEIKKLNRN